MGCDDEARFSSCQLAIYTSSQKKLWKASHEVKLANKSMEKWQVPLRMSKLHTLATHKLEFVEYFGSLGSIAEQSFEHYQGLSRKHSDVHSPNQCKGIQMGEDLIHGWLQYSLFYS